MPQAANIVLADAQATPVNHTYVPLGPDKAGLFWYEDQSQASALGYWRISVDIRRPSTAVAGQSSANRTTKIKIGLHQPALENVTNSTVSGVAPAPTLSYVPRAFAEFVLPERASLQNRKDLRKMLALLLGETSMVSVIEGLQFIY